MLLSTDTLNQIRTNVAMYAYDQSFAGEFAVDDDVDIYDARPKCKLTATRVHCGYSFRLVIAGVDVYHEHGKLVTTRSGRLLRLSPTTHAYATRR